MNGVTDYFPAFKEFGLRLVAFAKEDPEDFPQEEVSKTLSYHFFGIMSIIKPGKEVEDVKPQLKNYERP